MDVSQSEDVEFLPNISMTACQESVDVLMQLDPNDNARKHCQTRKYQESTSSKRIDYLKQKLRENDEHAERQRRINEMLEMEEILDHSYSKEPLNESVKLDPNQEKFLEKMIGVSDPFVDRRPKLDNMFVLENTCPLLYQYPLACLSEEYKSKLRKAHPDITDKKIIDYAMTRVDVIEFGRFLQQIPSPQLKKQVINCFFLNTLTLKSNLKLHHAHQVLEMIAESDEIACTEWYLSDHLLFKFFTHLGLDVNKLTAYFPAEFDKFLTSNSFLLDIKTVEKPLNGQKNKEMLDMSIVMAIRVLKLSLINKFEYYKTNKELEHIVLLLCALILDENFDLEENLSSVLHSTFQAIFKKPNDIDLTELSITLARIFNTEHVRNTIEANVNNIVDVLHHRIVYLIRYVNPNSGCQELKLLATKLALSCLQDIFSKFTNELFPMPLNENQIGLVIDLLEKHSVNIFTNSSYTMSNVIQLISIIVENFFHFIDNKQIVLNFLDRLKSVANATIRQVRDQMDFNGRVQVKIMLSHFAFMCDQYIGELAPSRLKRLSCERNVSDEGKINSMITNLDIKQMFEISETDESIIEFENL